MSLKSYKTKLKRRLVAMSGSGIQNTGLQQVYITWLIRHVMWDINMQGYIAQTSFTGGFTV